ncbi:MAG: hypothetical protein AB8B87_15625 [Granulosicoccus sp.]
MDDVSGAVAPADGYFLTVMVSAVIAVILLSSCSSSSDKPESEIPEMNNDNTSEISDPTGQIAQLEFLSAEDDADFQCLLNEATASATSRGLQAYPVINEDSPMSPGVFATWCKTVGSGDAVNADISSCNRYLSEDIVAPGTQALQLFARRDRPTEPVIQEFGLKSITMPIAAESGALKAEYTRTKGRQDSFFLAIIPFEGNTIDQDLRISIGSSYAYIDSDINLREFYSPSDTVAEQMNQLANSEMQFKVLTVTALETLKSQVEQAIDANASLDTGAKQAALEKATNELNRRIDFIDQNSEVFYNLMIEQVNIEQCG